MENSKREADLIRKETEMKANKMIEEAKKETQKLKEEMITLQTQKHSLIARLRHILSSQLELLEVLEIDDLDVNKLKDRSKKVFSGSKNPVSEVKNQATTDQKSSHDHDEDIPELKRINRDGKE